MRGILKAIRSGVGFGSGTETSFLAAFRLLCVTVNAIKYDMPEREASILQIWTVAKVNVFLLYTLQSNPHPMASTTPLLKTLLLPLSRHSLPPPRS